MLTTFLKYLQVERNYSVQTIRAYGDDLRQFFSFCKIEPTGQSVGQVNHRTIRAWLSHLLDTDHSSRSVNRKLSSLRSFYRFLILKGYTEKNPMNKIMAPKVSKKMPYFLTVAETDKLLDSAIFANNFWGLRDLLVIDLFYFTGLRVAELANLLVSDVSLESNTLKILGKGAKERIVPIHPELMPILSEYIKQKEGLFASNQTSHLIVSNKGGAAYPKLLYRIVNKYLSVVTSLEKKSPHVLRHTFATHLLNQGADINAIKELLGHANLSATQVYTHTSVEKLKSAYNQAHPRA